MLRDFYGWRFPPEPPRGVVGKSCYENLMTTAAEATILGFFKKLVWWTKNLSRKKSIKTARNLFWTMLFRAWWAITTGGKKNSEFWWKIESHLQISPSGRQNKAIIIEFNGHYKWWVSSLPMSSPFGELSFMCRGEGKNRFRNSRVIWNAVETKSCTQTALYRMRDW